MRNKSFKKGRLELCELIIFWIYLDNDIVCMWSRVKENNVLNLLLEWFMWIVLFNWVYFDGEIVLVLNELINFNIVIFEY